MAGILERLFGRALGNPPSGYYRNYDNETENERIEREENYEREVNRARRNQETRRRANEEERQRRANEEERQRRENEERQRRENEERQRRENEERGRKTKAVTKLQALARGRTVRHNIKQKLITQRLKKATYNAINAFQQTLPDDIEVRKKLLFALLIMIYTDPIPANLREGDIYQSLRAFLDDENMSDEVKRGAAIYIRNHPFDAEGARNSQLELSNVLKKELKSFLQADTKTRNSLKDYLRRIPDTQNNERERFALHSFIMLADDYASYLERHAVGNISTYIDNNIDSIGIFILFIEIMYLTRIWPQSAYIRALETFSQLGDRVPEVPQVNAVHVHRESRNVMQRMHELLPILSRDIGNVEDIIATMDPPPVDIYDYLTKRIKTYIDTSDDFRENRDQWQTDFQTIITKLREHDMMGILTDDIQLMIKLIVEFVWKYGLQDCFIRGYVFDCAHAYNRGPGAASASCVLGMVERFPTTFRACIATSGRNGGVFDEIKMFFRIPVVAPLAVPNGPAPAGAPAPAVPARWENIDRESQLLYMAFYNRLIQAWTNDNQDNEAIRAMNKNTKNTTFMNYIKEIYRREYHGQELPAAIEARFQREINDQDWDYLFYGGRRHTKKLRTRKVRKHRKH